MLLLPEFPARFCHHTPDHTSLYLVLEYLVERPVDKGVPGGVSLTSRLASGTGYI